MNANTEQIGRGGGYEAMGKRDTHFLITFDFEDNPPAIMGKTREAKVF